MWWVCGGNLLPQSHPRPLVCGFAALNQWKPTQMATPLQTDWCPSTVGRCNMER